MEELERRIDGKPPQGRTTLARVNAFFTITTISIGAISAHAQNGADACPAVDLGTLTGAGMLDPSAFAGTADDFGAPSAAECPLPCNDWGSGNDVIYKFTHAKFFPPKISNWIDSHYFHKTKRIVLFGRIFNFFICLAISIIIATLHPLSLAPVPRAQESR